MTALPTRRDEAWRYSDIDAVAAAWPLPAPESIIVPAGGDFRRAIVQDAGDIRQIEHHHRALAAVAEDLERVRVALFEARRPGVEDFRCTLRSGSPCDRVAERHVGRGELTLHDAERFRSLRGQELAFPDPGASGELGVDGAFDGLAVSNR